MNLLKRYAAERTVSVFAAARGAGARGPSAYRWERSSPRRSSEQWLVEEAPPLAPVVEEIRARCSTAGERPPSYIAAQTRNTAVA